MNAIPCSTQHSMVPRFHHSNILWDDSERRLMKAVLPYQVAYADTDMMGVVYYAAYLVFFERARTRLLEELGYPYPRLEAEGFGLPVTETYVKYRVPATYGDTLSVYAWPEWVKPVRLKVGCEVRRDGRLLVSGYTVHACLNLKRKRPTQLPDEFRRQCLAFAEAEDDAEGAVP